MTFSLFKGTRGAPAAPIVLVGEAWGAEEAHQGLPFVGQSGVELDRMIREAEIDPADILFTNVISERPASNEFELFLEPNEKGKPKWKNLHPTPQLKSSVQRLYQQIAFVERKIVIACGNYALWAMTPFASVSTTTRSDGARVLVPGGITSWRGSMMECSTGLPETPALQILPIIHPAAILRAWYQRAVTVHDLRTRVRQAIENDWRPAHPPVVFAPPSFDEAIQCLRQWQKRMDEGEPLRLAHDIETSRGLITCMGFADSERFALVVPFVRPGASHLESFWSIKQEVSLARLIGKILVHPNVLVEGQNYIYDTQYIQRYSGIVPKLDFDTMLAHHLLFPGTPKGLDYLSSLYCHYHWYWKEDLKEWDQHINFETNLQYNAIDVMRTFECATVLRRLIIDMGQCEQWEWEKRKATLALEMMNRGILIDGKERSRMAFALFNEQQRIGNRLEQIIPQEFLDHEKPQKTLWHRSAAQQRRLFYDILGLHGQTHRKTGNPTVNDEALKILAEKNPLLRPIFQLLESSRSIGVFYSTFVSAALDYDGRMRCSFNPAGAETFRWSSSANAFGGGTNLQNVPKGDED